MKIGASTTTSSTFARFFPQPGNNFPLLVNGRATLQEDHTLPSLIGMKKIRKAMKNWTPMTGGSIILSID
jgi:hypothetical protein